MTDTFIVYRVESTPKTYAFLEPRTELTFSFGAFPVVNTSNVSGGGTSYSFTDSDLTEDGWRYFTHPYGATANVSVFKPGDPDPIEINPDIVTYSFNQVGVNFGDNMRPLGGTWSILIEV